MRDYYVQCMADHTRVVLLVEFKLFAVRHPKLHPKLAAVHSRIRASMKVDDVEKRFGLDDNKRNECTRAVLEGLFTGLFPQHAFQPERLSEHQAAYYPGALFDFLLQPLIAAKIRPAVTALD